uniref:Cell division control protein 45 n=1 Tax=Lygus hesperus TaxID=30085 RepID=A0A0A9YQW4_LYGHE
MMFVEDLSEDFINHISGEHILLFVNYDVDAVCACRILQNLFRSESTLYTLVPVEGTQELVEAYKRFSDKVKYVVFINCGGSIDLVETLEPEPDVLLFVIDSHKPSDICNVYSRSQVRLIGKPDESENIPQFEDIFLDTDTEPESEEEEINEEALRKRRERKLWEEKRNRVMFDYTQFSFCGRASSLVVFELIWNLGKDDLESLWWAIVGLTYQTVMGLIVEQKYACELQVLQLHLSRLTSISQNDLEANRSQFYRITAQKDLRLVLYRHWNVQASLRHTICSALKLKLWTVRSEKRLYQVLAEIGLPLKDSLQNFSSMDVTLRNEFFSMAETIANNYDLDELIYHSFTVSVCYGNNFFQASDYVYAMICLLEDTMKDKSRGSCFSDCIDSLSPHKYQLVLNGIEKCKKLFTSIIRLVQSMLDMKQIISAGPFLYFIINENTSDYSLYAHPMSLAMLARYALNACASQSNYRKHGSLPLIVSAPQSEENCIVLGIPPVTEYVPRNFFGKAFDQALETMNTEPVLSYFDSAAVRISIKDRPKFFDSLSTILS